MGWRGWLPHKEILEVRLPSLQLQGSIAHLRVLHHSTYQGHHACTLICTDENLNLDAQLLHVWDRFAVNLWDSNALNITFFSYVMTFCTFFYNTLSSSSLHFADTAHQPSCESQDGFQTEKHQFIVIPGQTQSIWLWSSLSCMSDCNSRLSAESLIVILTVIEDACHSGSGCRVSDWCWLWLKMHVSDCNSSFKCRDLTVILTFMVHVWFRMQRVSDEEWVCWVWVCDKRPDQDAISFWTSLSNTSVLVTPGKVIWWSGCPNTCLYCIVFVVPWTVVFSWSVRAYEIL